MKLNSRSFSTDLPSFLWRRLLAAGLALIVASTGMIVALGYLGAESPVHAIDTTLRAAGQTSDCVNDTSAGSAAWTNPGNAATLTGNGATNSIGKDTTTNRLKCTGFDFTNSDIPVGSTINGIRLTTMVRREAAQDIRDSEIRLVKAGSVVGDNMANSAQLWYLTTPPAGAIRGYGSTTDLWGTTWTQADVTSAGFGAVLTAVRAGGGPATSIGVGYLKIQVSYTPPPVLTQSGYRVFSNADSTDVGSPVTALNTPATLTTAGQAFRLRQLLHHDTNPAPINSQSYLLQYVDRGAGSCAVPTGTSPRSYTTIGPAGQYWTEETAAASWTARSTFGSVAFNNKIWVMGGLNSSSVALRDVWWSSDGNTWTQATSSAGWSARYYFPAIVFNNKIWVMGGSNAGVSKNDVWSSSDGATWTQETAAAGWSTRYLHSAIVFNNKIWVMGGIADTGDGRVLKHDVWSSSDGISWTQETTAAGWSARWNFSTAVFNNKMWVLGGAIDSFGTPSNDVWSSSDGITWTQETAAAGWSARSAAGVAVYGGKLWMMGGNTGNPSNDVWSSSDGATWTQVTGSAEWAPRSLAGVIADQNRLWVYGGRLEGGGPANDIWSSAAPVIDWNDNAAPTNGSNLTANANDPTHSGHTNIYQEYLDQSGIFSNAAAAVAVGEDAMWDFSLKDNGAPTNTTYCFRVVKSDGLSLDTYTYYPEITTASAAPTPTPSVTPRNDQLMRGGKWFKDGVLQPYSFVK